MARKGLKVLIDMAILPMKAGQPTPSISKFVAATGPVFDKYKLKTHVHSWGTNVEGEWDTVWDAVRECHEVCHDMGAGRVISTFKVETRSDGRIPTIDDTLAHLEAAKKTN